MNEFTAVYDACVLYPASLRDLLMHVAVSQVILTRWSNAIHEEWIEALLARNPRLVRQKLERTRDQMNSSVRDCLVVGYEWLIPTLSLPDPNDRHVLAAAISAKADVIVTFNLDDFPARALRNY